MKLFLVAVVHQWRFGLQRFVRSGRREMVRRSVGSVVQWSGALPLFVVVLHTENVKAV